MVAGGEGWLLAAALVVVEGRTQKGEAVEGTIPEVEVTTGEAGVGETRT